MTVSFNRRPWAYRSSTHPPTVEVGYVCEGLFTEDEAKAAAVNLTPTTWADPQGILFRNQIAVDEVGHKLFNVDVTYGRNAEYRISFSTAGGTLHIKNSRQTVSKYWKEGTPEPPFHSQAIDLDENGEPRGTEVVIPVLKLSYHFRHQAGVINENFAQNAARITGCCNSDAWHGYEPGEVLLLGADGTDGTDQEAEVTWHVAAEENLSGLVIDGISGIAKDGHDFLWVWYRPAVKDKDGQAYTPGGSPSGQWHKTTAAKAVYVERLYRRINFAAALGF